MTELKYGNLYITTSNLTGRALTWNLKALPKKMQYLDALESTAELREAAKAVNLKYMTVRLWRYKDAEFEKYINSILLIWRGNGLEKKCKTCFKILPLTAYYIREYGYNKQRNTCIECTNIRKNKAQKRFKAASFFKYKALRLKSRSQSIKCAYNLDAEYLESIWTGVCPVFDITLDPTAPKNTWFSCEVDRINPELGYIKGNVVWLSHRANKLKNNGTLEEFKKLVTWMGTI